MKKLIVFLVLFVTPVLTEAQPAPTFPASQAQVDAGTVFSPFYVTPLTLQNKAGNSGITSSQLTAALAAGTNAVSLTNATAGTLPRTAADSSWMSITQAVAYSNSTGLPVIGNTVVITGTNVNGAILVAPTNFPASGGLSSVTTTNQIWYDTNTITHTSVLKDTNDVWTIMTNGVVVARIDPNTGTFTGTNFSGVGPGTNWFGGDTLIQYRLYAQTNTAVFNSVASGGLHSIGLNQQWTNDLGARADLVLQVTMTNGIAAWPIWTFTNAVTGECYTNKPAFVIAGTNLTMLRYSDISPGDFGSFSNYGPVGSVVIVSSKWKLK